MDFFYPSFCLNCNERVFGEQKWICKTCFEAIEWIDTRQACQSCGKPRRDAVSIHCRACQNRPIYLAPIHSCFYPEGPAYALHEYLRVYECEKVAKLFASLMMLRWKKLDWPYPEAVVPIPDTRLMTYVIKKQPSYLIGKALSQLFSVPFRPVITTVERGSSFGYRPKLLAKGKCTDQKVLLISDVVQESESLRLARECLFSLFPKTIYTLGLFDRR